MSDKITKLINFLIYVLQVFFAIPSLCYCAFWDKKLKPQSDNKKTFKRIFLEFLIYSFLIYLITYPFIPIIIIVSLQVYTNFVLVFVFFSFLYVEINFLEIGEIIKKEREEKLKAKSKSKRIVFDWDYLFFKVFDFISVVFSMPSAEKEKPKTELDYF